MENLVNARGRRLVCATLATLAAVLLLGSPALAQEPATNSQAAPAGEAARPEAQVATPPAPVTAAQEVPQEPAPSSVLPIMRIRGYADVSFGKPQQEKLPEGGLQNSKSSFQIADFHL